MLFNSHVFIFAFLPVCFIIYFALNRFRLIFAGKAFLVFASLFFYSWWDVKYFPIIGVSILFNFVLGSYLSRDQLKKSIAKKTLLLAGIAANLSVLGYFKYADFFIENINLAAGTSIGKFNLVLPLAISFFTFQQVAYLVDSYKEGTKEYDFLNYSLFVTFFPQLIAGPIVHHREMMPQFFNLRNKIINYENIAKGIFIFAVGLGKKILIADTFAIYANYGFDSTASLSFFTAWITSLSYTFQLYFDFSGYSDMAVGLGLLFNIKLPFNFNSPYKALNIQDFWRRWHMTLSRFLRDYIYIPLGGNQKGQFVTYFNLMATFVLGGLWHGAGWTFIFWGFMHGAGVGLYRFWSGFGIKMPKALAWFITFNFANIAWVFFRAKEWKDAVKVLHGMFAGPFILPEKLAGKFGFLSDYGIQFGNYLNDSNASKISILLIITGMILVLMKNVQEIAERVRFNYVSSLFTAVLFAASIVAISSAEKSEFLYFNF